MYACIVTFLNDLLCNVIHRFMRPVFKRSYNIRSSYSLLLFGSHFGTVTASQTAMTVDHSNFSGEGTTVMTIIFVWFGNLNLLENTTSSIADIDGLFADTEFCGEGANAITIAFSVDAKMALSEISVSILLVTLSGPLAAIMPTIFVDAGNDRNTCTFAIESTHTPAGQASKISPLEASGIFHRHTCLREPSSWCHAICWRMASILPILILLGTICNIARNTQR